MDVCGEVSAPTNAQEASLRDFVRINIRMMSFRWSAVAVSICAACATVVKEPTEAGSAPDVAVALARLLSPLASEAVTADLVGSNAWPGARLREDGGVVQVDFGQAAEARCGFFGRFTLTRHQDRSWLVSIDELRDGDLRYWGTAEVAPSDDGLTLSLDLLVLEGNRGAELIVSGRIRRVEGRWRIEAVGTWNDGARTQAVRIAKGLLARPSRTPPPRRSPSARSASDKSLL